MLSSIFTLFQAVCKGEKLSLITQKITELGTKVEIGADLVTVSGKVQKFEQKKYYIALNKPEHKANTPIKIYFKTDTPHTINNKSGWFSDFLNGFVKQTLGETSVEQAEQELKELYSDEKGRKGDNPYLNYIINGTYNFIRHFMPSDTVTVTQCKFLLEYLRIIEQVKEGDSVADINYLQSKVKSLISSKHTPVQKHVKSQSMRSILA